MLWNRPSASGSGVVQNEKEIYDAAPGIDLPDPAPRRPAPAPDRLGCLVVRILWQDEGRGFRTPFLWSHCMLHTCTLCLLALALPVMAQTPREPRSNWSVSIGAGVAHGPVYAGSEESKTTPFPMLTVGYQDWLVLGEDMGLAVIPLRRGPWSLKVTYSMPEGREASDAKALRGMGNAPSQQWLGTAIGYEAEAFQASLKAARDLKGHAGTQVTADVGRVWRLGQRQALVLNAAAIWGNRDNLAADFGITTDQAARRRALIVAGDTYLRPEDGEAYAPSGGMREGQLRAVYLVHFTPRTSAFVFAEHGILLGDARKSPLTRSKETNSFGAGLKYQLKGAPRH